MTSKRKNGRSGGFVLVGILILIMLASMVALSLMFHLRAEETALAASGGSQQAWSAAMSGVAEAMRVAGGAASGQADWQDSPASFREHLVFDNGSDRWYFSVFTMGEPGNDNIRFGLSAEAGKLNVNTATEEMLSKLPKMTPYLAEGLLDYMDPDALPHPEGAEQEYYDLLDHPYAIANAPLNSLEELLLVRGFTPALFYGEDANLNFQLEPNENDGDDQFPPDNKDGKLDMGLRQYLTVSSYDINQDSAGLIRANINDPDDKFSEDGLPPATAQYIQAIRRNHQSVASPADLLEASGKFKDEKGQEVQLASGVTKAELGAILDRFTTTNNYHFPGLIDVNSASQTVLKTIPEIDDALAEAIVSARRNLRPEQRRTPAWLYEEGVVPLELFKKLIPLLTSRSWQFHFQVIGYGVPSGQYRVLEVIIDMAAPTPAIAYLRDITRLGLPFEIDTPDLQSESPAPALATVRNGRRGSAALPLLGTAELPLSPMFTSRRSL